MIKKVYLTLCFSLVSLFVVFHSYILPLINSVKKKMNYQETVEKEIEESNCFKKFFEYI